MRDARERGAVRVRVAACVGVVFLLATVAALLLMVLAPDHRGGATSRAVEGASSEKSRRRVARPKKDATEPRHRTTAESGVGESVPARPRRALRLEGIVLDSSGDAARAGVDVVITDALAGVPIALVQTEEGGWWAHEAMLDEAITVVGVHARDAADDRRSGESRFEIAGDRGREFLVLRLRTLVTVIGRVVDALSMPVAGATVHVQGDRLAETAWTSSEYVDHRRDVVVVQAAPDGQFRARVRSPGGTVRAWPVGADGVWGLDVADAVRGRDEVDLGDIALPGHRVTRWTISVRDAEGRPCANSIMRFVGREFGYTKTRPDFDEMRNGLVVGEDGVVELAFASGRAPIVLAIGGGWFVPRQFAVDLSTAGEQSAAVTLARRAVAIVRFTGMPAPANDIDELFVQVTTEPAGVQRSAGTEDIRSGAPSSASPAPYAAPITLLRGGRDPARHWISDDELEIVTDVPSSIGFTLTIEGVEVSSGKVNSGIPPQRHTIEIGPTRLVRLDYSALAASARDAEPETWVPPVAVWPHRGDASVAANGAVSGDADVTGFITLRDGDGTRSTVAVVAVPPGVEQLALGTMRSGRTNGGRASRRRALALDAVLDVPLTSGEPLVVPPARLSAALLGTIRVRVRYADGLLRRAGVPLVIRGRDASNYGEDGTAWTDASGMATFRVAPGTYGVAVNGSIVGRRPIAAARPTVVISEPGDEVEVVVDLAWPRE